MLPRGLPIRDSSAPGIIPARLPRKKRFLYFSICFGALATATILPYKENGGKRTRHCCHSRPRLTREFPDSVRQYATVGQTERHLGRANAVGEASAIALPSARLFSSSVRQQATAGRRNGLSPRECRRRDFRNRAAFCKIAFRQCSPVSNSRRCGNSPRLPFKRRREDFCGTCALRSSLKIRQAAENAREKTVLQGGGDASQSEKHANHKTFASVKGLWPFGLLSVTHQKTACAEEMAKAKALPRAVPYAPSTSSSIAESGGRKRARPARRAHAKFVYSR